MEHCAWPKNLSSSRKHEIKELLNGQNPAKRLRHLFDAHSQTGNNGGQPLFAEDLVVNVLRSFSNTLSLSSSDAESYEVLQVPTNACARSEVSEGSESIDTPPVPRKTLDTWTRHDQSLIDDGHQWSTDDQQSILHLEAYSIKGAWIKEEDDKLVAYIRVHGARCWRFLPKAAGLLRSGESCRLRWINYLDPGLKWGNFTEKEEVFSNLLNGRSHNPSNSN